MAWTAPATWTTGQLVSAADMNAQVRDNLLETAPAKATTKGDSFWATAANAISRLGVGADGTTVVADSTQAIGAKWANVFAAESRLLTLPRLEGNIAADGAMASATWPAANRGIFIPVYLSVGKTLDKIHVANGAAVSGNIDVGIFDASGNRLQSKGSTAQSGTTAEQVFDITNQAMSAKTLYYIGIAMDNTTGTLIASTTAVSAVWDAMGFKQAAAVFALPSTVTFAAMATAFIPMICLEFTA